MHFHPGVQLAVAMWAMTGFSLVLVILRLYTRIRIVKFVGSEDYMYATTGVSYSMNGLWGPWLTGVAIPSRLHCLYPGLGPLWTGTELLGTRNTRLVRRYFLDVCREYLCHYWQCHGQIIHGPFSPSCRPGEVA